MSYKSILIIRTRNNSNICLETKIVKADGWVCFKNTSWYMSDEETNFIEQEYDFDFLHSFGLEHMKQEIIRVINQLRENNRNNTHQSVEIPVTPRELSEPHRSCKTSQNEATEENHVNQSELQEKLSALDKESEVLKSFEENRCSVCLSNYKEIIEENYHIVVPSCGHPLCCKCADNILASAKKECPCCRGTLTLESFSLLKFNCDLKIDRQDQKLYL